jgi:hypothetical protein
MRTTFFSPSEPAPASVPQPLVIDADVPPAAAGGRQALLLVLATSLLGTIPVWIPTFPPMTDLPQHAVQITLLRAMLHPGFAYADLFDLNWFTPYLFGYGLVYGLVPFVGIVAACKIVIACSLVALPLSTALVMTETGTDRRWAMLAVPAMYGFSYHWGFLNFLVAAPVGLVFLWLTLRQARQPSLGKAIALAAGIILLFFCHALMCVFFGFIAGCILLWSGKSMLNAIARVLPLTAVLPVAMLWGLRRKGPLVQILPPNWDLNWLTTQDVYYSLIAQWTTPDGWGWGRTAGLFPRLLGGLPGPLTTLVGLAIVLLPFAAGARTTRRPMIWVPFLVCMAVLLFVPGFFYGTDFIYQRFTVFALPLFLILLQPRPGRALPRWTWPACAALVAGWIAVVSMNAVRYEREAAGFDEILAHMEPGQRAMSFAFERDSDGTIAPPFLHFPAWYSAIKGGVVDPNAASEFAAPVFYRPGKRPVARPLGFEWDPGLFDWPLFHAEQYRYFVAKAPKDFGPWMFRNASCNTRLVYHVNHWWLYEKEPSCFAVAPPHPAS